MESIPYVSVVRSLMYVQTCTHPDISFAIGMLGRYQSNLGMDHWKATKKVLRYLQGTKDYMLTCKRSNHLKVIGYSNSDYVSCADSKKSISITCFYWLEEQFHAKVESSPSLLLPLLRLNLWQALKPLFMHCGCEILSLV